MSTSFQPSSVSIVTPFIMISDSILQLFLADRKRCGDKEETNQVMILQSYVRDKASQFVFRLKADKKSTYASVSAFQGYYR